MQNCAEEADRGAAGGGMSLEELYTKMKSCNACKMRSLCTQVVPAEGQINSPKLLIVGEAPGADEDREGRPFVGMAGQLLREVLRETKILNKGNTLISNVMKCRPPDNKFPKNDCPSICVSLWLNKEIELAKPQRMLLLGAQPLKFVAGLTGVTLCRGKWYEVKGVRTMITFHPSYVARQDRAGDLSTRRQFEDDIYQVALEVKGLEDKEKGVDQTLAL
jgi:uracil-DNA glycosylase